MRVTNTQGSLITVTCVVLLCAAISKANQIHGTITDFLCGMMIILLTSQHLDACPVREYHFLLLSALFKADDLSKPAASPAVCAVGVIRWDANLH